MAIARTMSDFKGARTGQILTSAANSLTSWPKMQWTVYQVIVGLITSVNRERTLWIATAQEPYGARVLNIPMAEVGLYRPLKMPLICELVPAGMP
jgi:hypothetical protein